MRHDTLLLDSELVDPGVPVSWWPEVVFGRILEVGLGVGWHARNIPDPSRIRRWTVIESRADVILATSKHLPAFVDVVEGVWPDISIRGPFDFVLLDVLDLSDGSVASARRLLADGGFIGVRE